MTKARPPGNRLPASLAVAVVVMALAGPAHAQITFDPDGPGGLNGDRSILALDWLPGNAVGIDAVPLTPASAGTTFIGLYQAKLGGTTGTTSSILGLNGIDADSNGVFDAGSFEITVVARFREFVDAAFPIGPTAGQALFHSDANQTGSFVEFYYDDLSGQAVTSGASDLAGTGFTDGLLILSGDILPGILGDSSFTSQFGPGQIVALDQAGTNNYPGQLTVTGSGIAKITTTVDPGYNAGFFKTPGLIITETLFNSSLIDPFSQVDPSAAFFVGDPRTSGPLFLGPVNGADDGNPATTQDFLFQADANQSFITAPVAVPEPGTMVLAITGLATVSLGSLRKLRRRSGTPAA